MAVTLNSYDRQVRAGTFGAIQELTVSTATTRQRISPHISITTIAGVTATSGPNLNALFTLPGATATDPPVEGMQKIIKMTGTGPSISVIVESLATGRLWGLFSTSSDDQHFTAPTGAFAGIDKTFGLHLLFLDTQWQVLGGKATISTGS